MAIRYFDSQEDMYMPSTKSNAKSAPAKRPAPAAAKPPVKAKRMAAPEPVAREPVAKAVPKKAVTRQASPKAAAAKVPGASAAKPKSVAPEQRRNYIEMAAYYIAERRAFAPGNLLDDWVQAEAEIDCLLAAGRLGG